MTEDTITGRLENWHWDMYFKIIWGNIYDDINKRFVDGTWIHTSDIEGQKECKEGDIVKTRNSSYLLGKHYV